MVRAKTPLQWKREPVIRYEMGSLIYVSEKPLTQENKVVNLEKIGVKGFSSEMCLLGPCEHTLKVHRPQSPGFVHRGSERLTGEPLSVFTIFLA